MYLYGFIHGICWSDAGSRTCIVVTKIFFKKQKFCLDLSIVTLVSNAFTLPCHESCTAHCPAAVTQ